MTDTRKEFEQAMRFSEEFRDGNIYQFSFMTAAWQSWQACQSLNDKRIDQLLAVIAKKDEALVELINNAKLNRWESEDAAEALALQPADVELVEVGSFVMHEDKIGNRYPSSQMSYNYDDFEIADINKLYTIKTKANTK